MAGSVISGVQVDGSSFPGGIGSHVDGVQEYTDAERLDILQSAWRCVMKKQGQLVGYLCSSRLYDESDLRQECYIKGLLCLPYARGSYREVVNYIYSVMANQLRDIYRSIRVRVQGGVLGGGLVSLDEVSGVLGTDERRMVEDVMELEYRDLRSRVAYLECLIGLDPDLRVRYWSWLAGRSWEALSDGEHGR